MLTNAYKYTDDGGRVKVGCVSSAGSVSITIEDTGAGIDEAGKDRIFEHTTEAAGDRPHTATALGYI